MSFAKFFSKSTACFLCLALASCTTNRSESDFNRSEAAKARINLALAYLEEKDFPKAKENIDKALHHDSQDYLPQSVLAYYYQQTGDNENAQKAYEQAIKLSQSRPDVLNNYGTFLCKQGKFEQAYQQFEEAMNSKQAYYHQADTLENLALCANLGKDLSRQQNALAQLEKLDQKRSEELRKVLE